MASQVDSVLKRVGNACTIIRSAGNVSTYLYINPKGSFERSAPYERNAMMPMDSGVEGGDLIQHLTDYYLAANIFEDRRVGTFFYSKVRLFKCNADVTIRGQNPTTKQFSDVKTGVHCLITSGSGEVSEDKANVLPRYSGKDILFACFAQASEPIGKNSLLVRSGVVYRVIEDIDPHFANGIIRILLKIEKYA